MRLQSSSSRNWIWSVLACGLVLASCAPSRAPGARRPLDSTPETRLTVTDASRLYQSVGLAASAGPMPFVGTAAHFAASTPDSTLTLLTISIPNRALSFSREGDRYRAPYAVDIRVLSGGSEMDRIEAMEVVRVGTFRETGRTDESVIFQRWLRLVPGAYTLRLLVRDVATARMSGDTLAIVVPRFERGQTRVATPLPVYHATSRDRLDTLPAIVPRPRATAVFGRDTSLAVYVEAYGADGVPSLPVHVTIRDDVQAVAWSGSMSLPRHGALFSSTLHVPVSRLGIGVGSVSVASAQDSATAPVFLTFGDDLPLAPFADMLAYLRFYVAGPRLRELRDATPERRGQLWAEFLRTTDPVPHTPEHEGLQAYFARIQLANARFRDEGPLGWLTDRGSAFVALGEPDNVAEQVGSQAARRRLGIPVRLQVWEYREHRVQLVFSDEEFAGRFRFVPRSEHEFRTLLQSVLVR